MKAPRQGLPMPLPSGVIAPGAPMSDFTQILSAIEQGAPHAAEQLLPLVYDELRKLAAQKLAQEKPGQTLQATALVGRHSKPQRWYTKPICRRRTGHAAHSGRERPTSLARQTRWGRERLELDHSALVAPEIEEGLIALDGALDKLAQEDPGKAELVKLR